MTRLSALLLVSALASAGCADPTHHADWMSEIAARYADRQPTMSDICWPRAHDAGTYAESYCRSRFSSACNTKTQELGMGAQLEAGVRAFDVRPERMDDDYFTHHTTTCGGLGCLGARLQDLLGELRTFLDQHREFVVIEVGGFCGTGADDAFYYRVQSPVIFIEFDMHGGLFLTNKEPSKIHVHTIVRTPNGNDYGIDVLQVPPSVAQGNYFVGLIVDPDDTLDEVIEDNNTAVGPQIPVYGASIRFITARRVRGFSSPIV